MIYGIEAMEHYKKIACIVYLQLSYETISSRLGNLAERGVVCRAGQTLRLLYEERCPLYERYADVVVQCDGLEVGEILELVEERL